MAEMFETVLVPVDLSDRNEASVSLAARLARDDGGVVHLLHVIEVIPGLDVEEEAPFYRRLEASASRYLEKLGAPLGERHSSWEARVLYGSRAATILAEAERLDCDLMVMRSHRVDGSEGAEGLGTLSYQVAILARCPVLLVK